MKRRLQDNLKRVIERIEAACARCRRSPRGVTLVAVTKYASLDVIRTLVEIGVQDFGESRPQELVRRAAATREWLERRIWGDGTSQAPAPGVVPRWHQIGPLQRNKTAKVLPFAHLIHSVDTLRLAEEIDAASARLNRQTSILLQVNATDEPRKQGVSVPACLHVAEVLMSLRHVRLCGLMAMGPNTADEARVRQAFERVGELFQEVSRQRFVTEDFRVLSMGMSHDFELAIAAGATMVRVGSALFEGIPDVREHAVEPMADDPDDGDSDAAHSTDAATDEDASAAPSHEAQGATVVPAVRSRDAKREPE